MNYSSTIEQVTDTTPSRLHLFSQKLKITDFSANISLIKNQLKKALFHQQHIEQTVQWTPEDFNFDKIKL